MLAGVTLALSHAQAAPATPAPEVVDGCRATPQFVTAVATAPDIALATDGREKGLILRSANGAAPAYQHPTWDDAGYLDAIAYDRAGNVYAAPTPRLSLADNPLAGAATLWRADTATGELRPFVTLPGAASERNPFTFSLQPNATDAPQVRRAVWDWDAAAGAWGCARRRRDWRRSGLGAAC